jgi:hypothetical protein
VERFPAGAVAGTPVRNPVESTIDLPAALVREGDNVLAIQGLNRSPESSDFSLSPVLTASVALEDRLEPLRNRLAAFRTTERARRTPALVAYFEGHLRRLEGEVTGAVEAFRTVLEIDPDGFEPRRTITECLLALRRDGETAREIRRLARAGDARHVPIWHGWLTLMLGELDRPVRDVVAELPVPAEAAEARAPTYVDEVRWALETIGRGETVRINCGAGRWTSPAGVLWERDRFFTGGSIADAQTAGWLTTAIEDTDDDALYAEGRFFQPDDPQPAGYRIPAPGGCYAIALHFSDTYYAKPGQRVFDVIIEGITVLEAFDLAKAVGFARADARRFETAVTDGMLDITFRNRIENPRVCAIEIERLE